MTRIAIVGAAHPHVEYLLDELAREDRRGFTLIGVQDPDRRIADAYAERFGVPGVTDAEALLSEQPDVVMVAGIYGDRGRDVVAALRAGAHVIADKPLCTSLAELAAIEEAAAAADRTVSLLLEKRGYPETLAVAEVVAAGELGEIVGVTTSAPHKLQRERRPEWFLDRARYGGVLADLAVHDLDIALLFAPSDEGVVQGAVSAPLEDIPDFARYGVATLRTSSAVVTAEVSWLTPAESDVHGDYRLRLVGTEGTAEVSWARHRVEVTTHRRGARLLDLPEGRRPAQDALDALASAPSGAGAAGGLAAGPGAVDTAASLLATRLALLAQESADQDGLPRPWSR
ncbi:Gfo/Idh/MocA family protein [Microbacterium resistens]|uniref:Gfo/Idh/MocA family protein n=1 Tax=Microbacterium resistens TaxID=156977 RepID=UPI00082C9D94|nr:Gfo/Idh/MocA family oxidoreductase [Microbacterium resistens]